MKYVQLQLQLQSNNFGKNHLKKHRMEELEKRVEKLETKVEKHENALDSLGKAFRLLLKATYRSALNLFN